MQTTYEIQYRNANGTWVAWARGFDTTQEAYAVILDSGLTATTVFRVVGR